MNGEHLTSLEPRLPRLPGASQVRSANLHRFAELVDRLGASGETMLRHHEIDPRVTAAADHHVDCQSLVNLLEDCALSFRDPLFGIHLAQLQQPDVYGCVTTLCRSAPTLRAAIACLVDYVPVFHSSESVLDIVSDSRVAEFRWSMHSDLGANDQANCHGVLLNLKVLRMLAGSHFVPSYVILPLGPTRRVTDDIARALGCAVRPGRDSAAIAFPAALLDTPVYSTDPALHALLKDYMSRARTATAPDLARQVGNHLRQALSDDASIEACARRLALSPRTLQARLRREGTCFSDILEARRLDRAREMLTDPAIPLPDIADLLGYAERTSFGRAFKRWTGLSPRQFRDRHGR